jgi:peptidoglycan/xylan/chitin deacetylase (PgdA/CDA1 family)
MRSPAMDKQFNHIVISSKNLIQKGLFYAGYKAIILMYHRVSNFKPGHEGASFETGVTAEKFELHMKYLKDEMTPIPLDDMVVYLKNGKRLPKKAVSITFDDGYADNYLNAYPSLKKYGIPATIFIVSGAMDSGEIFWWDKISEILKMTKKDSLKIDFLNDYIPEKISASQHEIPLQNSSEKDHAQNILCSWFNKIKPSHINRMVDEIQRRLEVPSIAIESDRHRILSPQELKEMAENGISYGAHTMTHLNLATSPISDAEREIRESKKWLEELLGKTVNSFAYPYGKPEHFNNDVVKIVSDCGFQAAYTAIPGVVSHRSHMYEMCRVGMGNQSLPDMITHINKWLYI